MIEIQTDVFDTLWDTITALVPEGNFRRGPLDTPSSFPFVSLTEVYNRPDRRNQQGLANQTWAYVGYQADIWAEDEDEAREIMAALDDAMRINFQAFPEGTSGMFTYNDPPTIYRVAARYEIHTDGTGCARA